MIFVERGAPLRNDLNLISGFFFLGRVLLILETRASAGDVFRTTDSNPK